MWVIEQAYNFTGNFWIVGLAKTKKIAEKYCRNNGFKWCKADGLFIDEQCCIRIEKHNILDVKTKEVAK